MSYRIRYEVREHLVGKWFVLGVFLGTAVWCCLNLAPVWGSIAAGEGLYDAIARFVGGMILGPH